MVCLLGFNRATQLAHRPLRRLALSGVHGDLSLGGHRSMVSVVPLIFP